MAEMTLGESQSQVQEDLHLSLLPPWDTPLKSASKETYRENGMQPVEVWETEGERRGKWTLKAVGLDWNPSSATF